ncbi:TraR/DksA C4-type zinc finger protein [Methylomagnum sp.]
MDDIDIAQYFEECRRDEALRRLKESDGDEFQPWVDEAHGVVICRDCEAPIPKERLAAFHHAVRCIDCQREYDRERALESRLYAGGMY